jgi:hypothetical protein
MPACRAAAARARRQSTNRPRTTFRVPAAPEPVEVALCRRLRTRREEGVVTPEKRKAAFAVRDLRKSPGTAQRGGSKPETASRYERSRRPSASSASSDFGTSRRDRVSLGR